MRKLILVPVFAAIALVVACSSGGNDTTPVTVHGHSPDTVFSVEIANDQLEDWLIQEGMFMCDVNMCHIMPMEDETHDADDDGAHDDMDMDDMDMDMGEDDHSEDTHTE